MDDPAGLDSGSGVSIAPLAGSAGPPAQAQDAAPEAGLATDPRSARGALQRAATELAGIGQMQAKPPPGFRLVLPRESAALQQREVYDLMVDGEVVGTIADRGFATYVREKCFRGEVFVDGRGAVKWRPRVPLKAEA